MAPDNTSLIPLPWQDRAVLVGPFAQGIERMQWYHRHERHLRQSAMQKLDPTRAQFGNRTAHVCSVPVPVKRVRSVLAQIASDLHGCAFYEPYRADWMLRFAADAQGWHEASILQPLDVSQGRYGTSISLQRMQSRARSHLQALREASFAHGSWWPAPWDVRVALHAQSLMCRASASFAPHYLDLGREEMAFIWPRPAMCYPQTKANHLRPSAD